MIVNKRIYKYPIDVLDEQEVLMPHGANILSIQWQRGELMLWALVQPINLRSPRKIVMLGTGHDFWNSEDFDYITTIQQNDGDLIWHIFEAKSTTRE